MGGKQLSDWVFENHPNLHWLAYLFPINFEYDRAVLHSGSYISTFGAMPAASHPDIEVIRHVAQGRIIFQAAAQRWQETGRVPNGLSTCEREVIECTTTGMTNPEIAQSLRVSANTVRFHLNSIFSKIRVYQAAAWYFTPKGE